MLPAQQAAIVRDLVARARLDREAVLADEARAVDRAATPPQVAAAIRYDTAEERREARLRTYRESKQRLYGCCPECGGKKAATPSVQVCRPCHLAAVAAEHGTNSKYASGCRCGLCRAAATEYHRARRARMVEWKAAA